MLDAEHGFGLFAYVQHVVGPLGVGRLATRSKASLIFDKRFLGYRA